MVSFKSINLDQISSANNINFVRIYKNKYENIAYKNYNNSQIRTDVNTIGPKIWDIAQVLKVESTTFLLVWF